MNTSRLEVGVDGHKTVEDTVPTKQPENRHAVRFGLETNNLKGGHRMNLCLLCKKILTIIGRYQNMRLLVKHIKSCINVKMQEQKKESRGKSFFMTFLSRKGNGFLNRNTKSKHAYCMSKLTEAD